MKTWLFTVANHAFINHYRKHKSTIIKEQSFFLSYLDKKKAAVETIVIQEEVQEIINMLKELPDKHKYAVLLHDSHGLSRD